LRRIPGLSGVDKREQKKLNKEKLNFLYCSTKFYVDKIVENENFEACRAYGEWNVVYWVLVGILG